MAATPGASFAALASLTRLGQTGHRGRLILQHRAMGRLPNPGLRLVTAPLLALAFTAALLALQGPIAEIWSALMSDWLAALELPGLVIYAAPVQDGWLTLAAPLIDMPVRSLSGGVPLGHACGVAVVWWAAGRLPDALKPGAYLLRFAVLIHAISVLFFWLWPGSFLHSVAGHCANGLRQAWLLMLVTPWLHLATYYLFPQPLYRCALLTLMSVIYLLVLTPLQYAMHAALLYHLGLVVMPLLHLLFGAMLSILGFVALYGWAMSWPVPDDQGA